MSIMDHLIHIEALQFFGWWQSITCFFAFLSLMAIWWHLGKMKKDFSQIWLALSVLCWSISGVVEIYYSKIFKTNALDALSDKNVPSELTSLIFNSSQEAIYNTLSFQMDGYSSLLSLTNSFFILMALPWFKHIPKSIVPIIKSKFWIIIIGLPFLFSLLPTLSKVILSKNYVMISELDVYYSTLTLAFLGMVLWESFAKRRLKLLAILSVVCILLTFIAQLYKLTGSEIDMRIISAIFKSALIMIFFALALSWVKDLSENILPDPKFLSLTLITSSSKNGKLERSVSINGIPEKGEVTIPLTQAPFELLKMFTDHKINGDKWLEIRPKNEHRNREYSINDYNEIKRLNHSMLDGIYGKGNWMKEKHEIAFKETFYEMPEKRERKLRLRIPAKSISYTS